MFSVVSGFIGFVQGRILSINGLEVIIPREGFAYIAAGMSSLNGGMVTRVHEIKGADAGRYSFMRIGAAMFENIIGQIEKNSGQAIPFQFVSKIPRRKMTVN